MRSLVRRGRASTALGGPGLRVNEVHSDEIILDEDVAVDRRRYGNIGLVFEHLSAARLVDQDGLHGAGNGCHGDGAACEAPTYNAGNTISTDSGWDRVYRRV